MVKILIFDSGVGGLSISNSLAEDLPMAELVLLSDNAYFPYGIKNDAELIQRVSNILIKAEKILKPDCFVIACNTASTVALETLRKVLNVPIVGVVPAVKPAAEISKTKVIGLLATPATIKRTYTADLINKYASDCEVISVGTTRLVEIVEMKLRGADISVSEVNEILRPILEAEKEQSLDTLILGCTHFPLLTELLIKLLPKSITLVDSSSAIARQVKNILNIEQTSNKQFEKNAHLCLMTKLDGNQSLDLGLKLFGFQTPKIFN